MRENERGARVGAEDDSATGSARLGVPVTHLPLTHLPGEGAVEGDDGVESAIGRPQVLGH